MPLRLRVVMLLVALMTLIGVATPPVIEDHLEVGFCSADCPVQHAGHAVGITTGVQILRASQATVFTGPFMLGGNVAVTRLASPDAPRAPPSA